MGYIILSVCPGSALGSPGSWTCLEYVLTETSTVVSNHNPKPLELLRFDAAERFHLKQTEETF